MLHIAGGVFLGLIFFTLFMAFLPLIVIAVLILVVLVLAIIVLTVYGVLAYYFTIPILALTVISATAISYNMWRRKRDDKEIKRLKKLHGPNLELHYFYHNSAEGSEWYTKQQKRGALELGWAILATFIFFNIYFIAIVSNPWELATTLASVYGYIILYIATLLVIAFIIMGIQWLCKRTFKAVVNALPHRP